MLNITREVRIPVVFTAAFNSTDANSESADNIDWYMFIVDL